jgi:trans-aconitate methyltransferase
MAERWYEQRKYAITMAMLPHARYRHAFEPGCSIGMLTERLVERCDQVTACDVAQAALDATRRRVGERPNLTLSRSSLDGEWPTPDVDLVVISEVAYYLTAATLRRVLDRECERLAAGATLVAAHWRHSVADYPLSGDEANALIRETADMTRMARYCDDDVVIDVLRKGATSSVAVSTGVPGAVGQD